MKALLLLALFAAGCGTEPDSRPVTFEVVVYEVLAPTCGQVQCHSTSTTTANYALDTLDAARSSLKSRPRVDKMMNEILEGNMPPDSPLPDPDLALLKAWVAAGTPGL